MDPLDSVLADVRKAYNPDPGAKDRVRLGIGATLGITGAGNLAAAPQALRPEGAMGSKVLQGASLGVKWGAGIGIAGAMAVGWLSFTSPSPTPAVATGTRMPDNPAHVETVPIHIDLALDGTVFGIVSEDHPDPSADVRSGKDRPADEAGEAQAAATEPKAASTLLEELRMIRQASQALREGDATKAQALLRDHRHRFPRSVLSTERRGLALLVQCQGTSSPSLRTSAERFLTSAPTSPLAAHVKKQCLP